MSAFDIILRSSAVLALGLVAHALLARSSAALRHFVLAGTILGSIAVIPLTRAVPTWDFQLPGSGQKTATVTTTAISIQTASTRHPEPTPTIITLERVIVVVWMAGMAFTTLLLLGELWGLVRVSSRARPVRRKTSLRHY